MLLQLERNFSLNRANFLDGILSGTICFYRNRFYNIRIRICHVSSCEKKDNTNPYFHRQCLLWLLAGLIAIYLFARSKIIDKGMRWLIKRALERFTSLRVYDYEQLLGLSRGYFIGELRAKTKSWCQNKMLKELQLDKEGIIVLGIYRRWMEKKNLLGHLMEIRKYSKEIKLSVTGLMKR